MRKIVAIANVAGGTSKTTTAHALAVACVEYGKKVLLLDLDVSTSLTFKLGLENERITLTDFVLGSTIDESQITTVAERFDFIPSDSRISSLVESESFAKFVDSLPKEYDVVLIDTPSTIDPRLVMAIEMADLTLIPVAANLHSIRGANQVNKIAQNESVMGFKIEIGSSGDYWDESFSYLDATIPNSELVGESLSHISSVVTQSNRSEVAGAYRELAYSLLEKLELI
jgi:cellulose biosynthesis protein BcsQ